MIPLLLRLKAPLIGMRESQVTRDGEDRRHRGCPAYRGCHNHPSGAVIDDPVIRGLGLSLLSAFENHYETTLLMINHVTAARSASPRSCNSGFASRALASCASAGASRKGISLLSYWRWSLFVAIGRRMRTSNFDLCARFPASNRRSSPVGVEKYS